MWTGLATPFNAQLPFLMGGRYVWLAACGALFWHGLHWALKNHLVRRLFEPVFRKYGGGKRRESATTPVAEPLAEAAEARLSERQVITLTEK